MKDEILLCIYLYPEITWMTYFQYHFVFKKFKPKDKQKKLRFCTIIFYKIFWSVMWFFNLTQKFILMMKSKNCYWCRILSIIILYFETQFSNKMFTVFNREILHLTFFLFQYVMKLVIFRLLFRLVIMLNKRRIKCDFLLKLLGFFLRWYSNIFSSIDLFINPGS